ncbi:SH3 domain-containing protein [Alistipes sp. ZOR0009]|uniref:SH3 domain-containing protein n=1 Tax=Alistipes sp. ZOR0009 TaxID=1339253 RepID=UPI000648FA36
MKAYLITLFLIISNISQSQDLITSTNNINFRKDSSTKSEVIQTFNKNTRVKLLEKGKTWSKVIYLNNTGYIHNKYLTTENKIIASKNNKTPDYTLLFLLLFIATLFLPRFLLQLTTYIENKYSILTHKRFYAKYLCQKITLPNKIENIITFFIGKHFSSYNSWVVRLVFISIFPLITSILIYIYNQEQFRHNGMEFNNMFDSTSLTISITITSLIYLLIFVGIIIESLIYYKHISIYRIPLLIIVSILSFNISILSLIIISFYIVIKIGIMILPILLFILSILSAFKIKIRINDNFDL